MLNKNNFGVIIIYIFLILLPLDYYITNVLFKGVQVISLWKEVFILLIVLCSLANIIKTGKLNINMPFMVMGLMGIYFLITMLLSSNPSASVIASRIYFEPLLLYMAVINFPAITRKEIFFVVRSITIEYGLISLYGLFQAFVLGQTFLENYIFMTNTLDNSFYIAGNYGVLRVNGTFVSPLDFALYAGLLVIFRFCMYSEFKFNALEVISIILILGGLMGTVTRSIILALLVILLMFIVKKYDVIGITKAVFGCLLSLLLLLVFDNQFLKGIVTNQILNSIKSTLSGSDPSAVAHANALSGGLSLLGNNLNHWLFGLGLGHNGPRATQYFSNPNLVESSYYLMIFEVGILGLFVYSMIYIFLFFNKPNGLYKNTVPYLTGLLLISYIFLPFVQSLPPILFYFLIVASIYRVQDDKIDAQVK